MIAGKTPYGGNYAESIKGRPAHVGLKQSKRALQEGKVAKAFVAEDADPHVTRAFVAECAAAGVDVDYVDSMLRLGHAAGIDRGAAVAVVLKQE